MGSKWKSKSANQLEFDLAVSQLIGACGPAWASWLRCLCLLLQLLFEKHDGPLLVLEMTTHCRVQHIPCGSSLS